MPIQEFSFTGVTRARIAFYPRLPQPVHLERFRERKFKCISCSRERLQDAEFVQVLDAVIFSQCPENPQALHSVLRASTPALLNNDVRVYVRVDSQQGKHARNLVVDTLLTLNVPVANLLPEERARMPKDFGERDGPLFAPCVYVADSDADWITIAHLVCDHPAGNPPNLGLTPEGSDSGSLGPGGHEERLLLLQRAFYDCSALHLEAMQEGLSGAPVFKAYATLKGESTGKWPYLHFVKVGPRKKIIDEYNRYISCTLDYVPFHLRPRLRLNRCHLGASQGILVSDFVEGAEPIRDCAPAGHTRQVIANLFDETLGAWRKQARLERIRTLEEFLSDKWLDEPGAEIHLPPARAEIVARLGGDVVVGPSHRIFNAGRSSPVLCGPAHGDLHATNVLVRGEDAVIIDFKRIVDDYPLLYDLASLEGGLIVDGFRRDARCTQDPSALLSSIASLYFLDVLMGRVIPCHAADRSAWFYDNVGEIRTRAGQAERTAGQYALVLALCLMRKGSNPASFSNEGEFLRAISFILGQRILKQIDEQRTAGGLRSATFSPSDSA